MRHARIAWRCRRGIRELDILLETFLTSSLESLANDDLSRLETLRDQPEQDSLAWLTGNTEPDDPDIGTIVTIIRNIIQSRSSSDERNEQ